MANYIDITGQRFNCLVAKNLVRINLGRNAVWNFVCDCGKETIGLASHAKNNLKKSCGCRRRMDNNRAAINRAMSNYVLRSKKHNRDFSLSYEQFIEITQKNCTYCNIKPCQKAKSRTGEYIYTGLDRKDNNIGYTIENTLPCCWICNSVKGEYMTVEDMQFFMSFKMKNSEDPWKEFRNIKKGHNNAHLSK